MAGSVFSALPTGPAPALGQQDNSSYIARASAAVAKYDDLLNRISEISDTPTRNDLLSWISDASIPGTPAERRQMVGEDLKNPSVANSTPVGMQRVQSLEQINDQLQAKVEKAEASFPPIRNPNQPGQVKVGGLFTPTGIGLGIVSVLSLLVVPFVLKGD